MNKKNKKNEIFNIEEMFAENSISLIADVRLSEEDKNIGAFTDLTMPILPLRNMVLFPNTMLPISAGRESSLKLIKDVARTNALLTVVCH